MSKRENELSDITEEELDISKQIVESILDLVGSNMESVAKYGIYIDDYYKLPMDKRNIICSKSYKYFKENGNFDFNSIASLIAHEADHKEEIVDPVVEAIREANVLIKKNREINTTGIRYE